MCAVINYIRTKIVELLIQFELPSEAALHENFPHALGCIAQQFEAEERFTVVTTTSYENMSSHWLSLSIPTQRHALRCRHCGVSAEYSQVPSSS